LSLSLSLSLSLLELFLLLLVLPSLLLVEVFLFLVTADRDFVLEDCPRFTLVEGDLLLLVLLVVDRRFTDEAELPLLLRPVCVDCRLTREVLLEVLVCDRCLELELRVTAEELPLLLLLVGVDCRLIREELLELPLLWLRVLLLGVRVTVDVVPPLLLRVVGWRVTDEEELSLLLLRLVGEDCRLIREELLEVVRFELSVRVTAEEDDVPCLSRVMAVPVLVVRFSLVMVWARCFSTACFSLLLSLGT